MAQLPYMAIFYLFFSLWICSCFSSPTFSISKQMKNNCIKIPLIYQMCQCLCLCCCCSFFLEFPQEPLLPLINGHLANFSYSSFKTQHVTTSSKISLILHPWIGTYQLNLQTLSDGIVMIYLTSFILGCKLLKVNY